MATLQSRGVIDAPALEAVATCVTLPPSPPPAASPPPPTRTPTDDDADADDDDTVPLFEIGDTPPLHSVQSSVGPQAPPPCLSAAPCSSSA